MPNYDVACELCGEVELDVYVPSWKTLIPQCPQCDGHRVKVWTGHANSVIGDECDVMVRHAICNPDGTPRRYTSKDEMKRAAAAKGMVNHFEHVPPRDSDKSKYSSRWI